MKLATIQKLGGLSLIAGAVLLAACMSLGDGFRDSKGEDERLGKASARMFSPQHALVDAPTPASTRAHALPSPPSHAAEPRAEAIALTTRGSPARANSSAHLTTIAN